MFTKQGLNNAAIIAVVLGVLGYIIGWEETAKTYIWVATGLWFLGIALGYKPSKVPRRAWRVFDSNYDTNELKAFLKDNPECAHALHFAADLPPRDLLKFTRLIIEARYKWDQEV